MTQTTALWLQLASQATAIANDMRDPEEEQLMREIAERYEALANRATPLKPVRDVAPDRT